MALHWGIQSHADTSCMVLWVIMTIASGISGSSVGFPSGIEAQFLPSNEMNSAYYRVKRTADEDTLQPPSSEENADSSNLEQPVDVVQDPYEDENSEATISKENYDASGLYEEKVKAKQNNKQQKYLGNDFKNYSSNKVTHETRQSVSNISIIEKQKLYSPLLKHSNTNKKDTKLNTNYSDYISKGNISNHTIPNKYMLENKKAKLETDDETINITKTVANGMRVNETHVMNDQPTYFGSDLNTTDSDDDTFDVLSQNTTDSFDDDNNTTSANGRTMPASEEWNIFIISGIVLGTIVLLGSVVGGGFVVYKQRMWNKPQTLSDKCSNADSSGYIDDSTLRENSEEMYSLDNDSFLNSLEAMTIQNYWTDNVKHTKL